MSDLTASIATTAWLTDTIRNLAASWTEGRARAKRYRETYRELSMLSDVELSDIGICRANIASIAREAALG